jgi:hypothetical protein
METKQDKRKALKELSKIAKMRMQLDCEGMSVNEILIEKFYTSDEHTIFKTLHDWNKEGYKINKGEKAFLIWGKPRNTNKEQTYNKEGEEGEEEENEFFPICYLFSNAQVTKKLH